MAVGFGNFLNFGNTDELGKKWTELLNTPIFGSKVAEASPAESGYDGGYGNPSTYTPADFSAYHEGNPSTYTPSNPDADMVYESNYDSGGYDNTNYSAPSVADISRITPPAPSVTQSQYDEWASHPENLAARHQMIIMNAKNDYDRALRAGNTEAMYRAAAMAENERKLAMQDNTFNLLPKSLHTAQSGSYGDALYEIEAPERQRVADAQANYQRTQMNNALNSHRDPLYGEYMRQGWQRNHPAEPYPLENYNRTSSVASEARRYGKG